MPSTLSFTHIDADKYANEVRLLSLKSGYTEAEISDLIAYSTRLIRNSFPPIFDPDHFSALVGYKKSFLYECANAPDYFYREFTIPKRSGGLRRISEPLPSLKEVQHWILYNILQNIPISPAARAYKLKSSIKKNARLHLSQPCLIKLDIRNFFPSLSYSGVFKIFYNCGYTNRVSALLASLCCKGRGLPQGAPTSPALSNILLYEFDSIMLNYVKQNNIRYSRYADDIVISGDIKKYGEIFSFVKEKLNALNLSLNYKKSAVLRSGARQVITGVVVNQKIQASRTYRREFRKNCYFIRKFGLDGHLNKLDEVRKNYLDHLIGIGQFIIWLNKDDKDAMRNLMYLRKLKDNLKLL